MAQDALRFSHLFAEIAAGNFPRNTMATKTSGLHVLNPRVAMQLVDFWAAGSMRQLSTEDSAIDILGTLLIYMEPFICKTRNIIT